MIISHDYKFIFIKTAKTAGTSIEVYLSDICGSRDVLTPIFPRSDFHAPRNYRGLINPLKELLEHRGTIWRRTFSDLIRGIRYYNHIPARLARARMPRWCWDNYFSFSVERNPYDKVLSLYNMMTFRSAYALTVNDFFTKGYFIRAFNYPYYTDRDGKVMVSKVLRYEMLDQDLGDVFFNLGIKYSGHLGVREKGAYKPDNRQYFEIFDAFQIELITSFYSREFELWGYKIHRS